MKAKALLTFIMISVLALSADFRQVRQDEGSSARPMHAAVSVLGVEASLAGARATTVDQAYLQSMARMQRVDEDGPAPALIIYMLVTLIGSVIAIGMVRQKRLR